QSPKAWSPSSPLDKGRPAWLLSASVVTNPSRWPILGAAQRRIAAFPLVPEARAANRPAAARAAALATGAAIPPPLGGCSSDHRTWAVLLRASVLGVRRHQ